MANTKVSQEMLLDGARMNIVATLAGIAGFLKEHNIPFRSFVDYMGEQFEYSLGELEGRGADEVMEHLLKLEILPMGAEVVSRSGTKEKAEVTLNPLPSNVLKKFGTTPKEFLSGFDTTPKEYETIFSMYKPAAKAIGLKFSHYSKAGQVVLSLEPVHRK